MGPTMRAIDPAAMFNPSMAPCRSGGDERLIRAEMLGMASDMPQAPIPMTMGMIHPADTGMTVKSASGEQPEKYSHVFMQPGEYVTTVVATVTTLAGELKLEKEFNIRVN